MCVQCDILCVNRKYTHRKVVFMVIFNAKYDRKNKRAITKECAIPDCFTLAEAWSHALTYFINSTNDDEILVDIKWDRIGEK